MDKNRVLFLCTGNSCRSQMAEAFLRKYAGEYFEVHSAGLEPKTINPLTLQVMEEIGFDLSQHTTKGISAYLGKVLFQYLINPSCYQRKLRLAAKTNKPTFISNPFDVTE